ncbi:MAG: metallophosphoesterase [Acidobacteriota bacterium]
MPVMKLPEGLKRTGFLPFILLFLLLIHSPLFGAVIPCEWSGIDKIVAVGDIHGDYDNLVFILQKNGLIDGDLRWSGEKTHFVQLGDIMDRGPDARKVFDLLMRLEKEAPLCGGRVHVLLGNHEESNLTGNAFDYPGYVKVEQFVSFLPDDYRRNEETSFLKKTGEVVVRSSDPSSSLPEALRDFWSKKMKERGPQNKYFENIYRKYGKWLLTKNVIIQINEIVFVHGGVSERLSTWDLSRLNDVARNEIRIIRRSRFDPESFPRFRPEIAYRDDGLYWHREYVLNGEETLNMDLTRVLKNLGASVMVVGHTTLKKESLTLEDVQRYDGRLYAIDTGIGKTYGSRIYALLYNRGEFSLWGGKNESLE